MAELSLTRDETLSLRARAHNLDPVVLVGANGLSEPVVKEIDRALEAHELIKVRAGRLEGEEREQAFAQLADRLNAARVQAIGHLLILFRPRPEPEPVRIPKKRAGQRPPSPSGRGAGGEGSRPRRQT